MHIPQLTLLYFLFMEIYIIKELLDPKLESLFETQIITKLNNRSLINFFVKLIEIKVISKKFEITVIFSLFF